MSDAIKAALVAACDGPHALCEDFGCERKAAGGVRCGDSDLCRVALRTNGTAIASFLRALPHGKGSGWQELWNTADLAAAVEKAARDE